MTDATTIVPDQTPEGEKRPRVTRRGGLFVNDAELIELSALPVLQTKVRFGKYRGQQWSQMDAGFLGWILRQKFDEDVRHTARYHLERRRGS